MTTTIEGGCVVEFTVLGLDGRRLLVRGITDGPIRLHSAVVMAEPVAPPDGTVVVSNPKPTRKRLQP